MWFVVLFFFFKQKTAYEMRISDWSSDVCSSDLLDALAIEHAERLGLASLPEGDLLDGVVHRGVGMIADHGLDDIAAALLRNVLEIGAVGLLRADRDDLVFLLGAGAGLTELVRLGLHGGGTAFRLLFTGLGVPPEPDNAETAPYQSGTIHPDKM